MWLQKPSNNFVVVTDNEILFLYCCVIMNRYV